MCTSPLPSRLSGLLYLRLEFRLDHSCVNSGVMLNLSVPRCPCLETGNLEVAPRTTVDSRRPTPRAGRALALGKHCSEHTLPSLLEWRIPRAH